MICRNWRRFSLSLQTPMSDLDKLRDPDNLRRAWRWVRSNADATYKSYFRPFYQNYSVAEDALLKDLADRLRRGIYEPEPACKLFHPKASGILRPYSLLSVEDQIVYQAATNLVAEKLLPRVRSRYLKQVFGHLYAGKRSTWFYRKWSNCYRAFNKAARQSFSDGYSYTASFDLTACYDSLDHHVLRHFLKKLGLDEHFCVALTDWLEKWTATDQGIFHHHGIPQGPLSSGLLSEVVLSHFDGLTLPNIDFKYFRYVDDIRLFARNEHDLRRLLVKLDILSKDIGLFPQSGKISIHRVTNIEDELKSASNPPEASIARHFTDQKRLSVRIAKLTPGFRIIDTTRFKYLLAHAHPSHQLTRRLWRILEYRPELYRSVCNYLRRYKKLPRVPAVKVVEVIKKNDLYQSVRAEFISAADGRLPEKQDEELALFLKQKCWKPSSLHPDILAVTGRYLIRTGHLTPRQVVPACKTASSWWTRAKLIEELNNSEIGTIQINKIIKAAVKDRSIDVALSASWKAYQYSTVPSGRRTQWNQAGLLLLRELGAIKRATAPLCGITHVLTKLDKRIPRLNWKKLLGDRYSQAERQAVETVAAANSANVTGFVNLLDVYNDLLLNAIYQADGTIGNYSLGHIGSVLDASTGRFATKFPDTFEFAKTVHEARYESIYSHPVIQRSGKPTKRINYRFLSKAKRLLRKSVAEILSAGIL